MTLLIGSHVSFLKGEQLLGCVEETLSYGGNAFMFYTGAPQNTNRASIDVNKTIKAFDLMKANNIATSSMFVHAPYIINLANKKNEDNYSFGISFLKQEIERCENLGVTKLILHPGNHVGEGIEVGLKNIANALNEVLKRDQNVLICLETMSGKGTECGRNFNELKQIIDNVKKQEKIMVCIDTCHLHDSGYDINNFDSILDEFDKLFGLSKLACIHLNDSKNVKGASKDRHDNFGLGNIGFKALINVIYNDRIVNVPKILETPYVTLTDDAAERIYPPYKQEIDIIKTKTMNMNLLDDIREYYKKTN